MSAQAQNNNSEIIHLKVKSQDNDEIFFKIKKTTQFCKLMEKYCERQGISNRNSVRFLFDGERIMEKSCPHELGMQNGDEIDVVIEQVGGWC